MQCSLFTGSNRIVIISISSAAICLLMMGTAAAVLWKYWDSIKRQGYVMQYNINLLFVCVFMNNGDVIDLA